jgi:hypothetical protein
MWTKWVRTFLVSGTLGLGAAGVMLSVPALMDCSAAQAKEGKERHPHIRAAIRELREAKKELETADHDFGGHRKEAVEAVDVAIRQLEKALKYDKK